MSARAYRPSNGSEGSAFEAAFCDRCRRGGDAEPACSIWMRSMSFGVGERGYPSEWIADDDGPRCTAFDDLSLPPKPRSSFRCRKTIDLFGEAP